MAFSPGVHIIGAGLAGPCCEGHLQEQGVSFQILEAFDGIWRAEGGGGGAVGFCPLAAR